MLVWNKKKNLDVIEQSYCFYWLKKNQEKLLLSDKKYCYSTNNKIVIDKLLCEGCLLYHKAILKELINQILKFREYCCFYLSCGEKVINNDADIFR